jgi:hypothetical protein
VFTQTVFSGFNSSHGTIALILRGLGKLCLFLLCFHHGKENASHCHCLSWTSLWESKICHMVHLTTSPTVVFLSPNPQVYKKRKKRKSSKCIPLIYATTSKIFAWRLMPHSGSFMLSTDTHSPGFGSPFSSTPGSRPHHMRMYKRHDWQVWSAEQHGIKGTFMFSNTGNLLPNHWHYNISKCRETFGFMLKCKS